MTMNMCWKIYNLSDKNSYIWQDEYIFPRSLSQLLTDCTHPQQVNCIFLSMWLYIHYCTRKCSSDTKLCNHTVSSREISLCIGTRLRVGCPWILARYSVATRDISLLQSVQTNSGPHPASYSRDASFFVGNKVAGASK